MPARRIFPAGTWVGVVLATGGMLGYDAWGYVQHHPAPSTASIETPLTPISVNPSWVRSGTPNFRATEVSRSADGKTVSGLWACDGPTTFEWEFGMDETVHLLEGEVKVDYLNHHFTLRPGDQATFHAGTTAIWHVTRYTKKSFVLHQPGRLVLMWRKFVATRAAV